ncbi:hypothetical protein ACHHYP_20721 [Achlya hypogyna]|uniref:Uncharacterized protein n=1 Tax=Achlya hypogyna TaxID=1202772 RepID=A0A1V9YDG5_ACHHY|nr:hypothetical protein ACHHYP_20721 [Achlya hypogyna]
MRPQHRAARGVLPQLIGGKYVYLLLVACAICVCGLVFEVSQLSTAFVAEPSKITHHEAAVPMGQPVAQINHKIAVVLTNYRDTEQCTATLQSLYERAEAPHGLHLFLFEEINAAGDVGNPNDASCLETFCAKNPKTCSDHRGRMQRKFRHASDHAGPSPARRFAEEMIPASFYASPADTFYLSIDSRLQFEERWDTTLLSEWRRAQNPNGILTIDPPSSRTRHWPVDHTQSAVMCTARIWSKQRALAAVDFNPPVLVKPPFTAPRLMAQYSEAFHFGPIHALSAAPSDPQLLFAWHGVAYGRATRWWTRGYDFYAPGTTAVYAHYVPRLLHPLQTPQWHAPSPDPLAPAKHQQRSSYARLQSPLLEGVFGLGTKRSLAQWTAFSHIYPTASYDESTDKQFMNCNPLVYVPT